MPYKYDGLPFKVPVADWLAKAVELFGQDPKAWKFECPVCGNVQTLADFEAVGAEPQDAYQQCIGRKLKGSARPARNMASTPGTNGKTQPCDYAAYGLFRALKGHLVIPEGGAKPEPGRDGKVAVFPFADPAQGDDVPPATPAAPGNPPPETGEQELIRLAPDALTKGIRHTGRTGKEEK